MYVCSLKCCENGGYGGLINPDGFSKGLRDGNNCNYDSGAGVAKAPLGRSSSQSLWSGQLFRYCATDVCMCSFRFLFNGFLGCDDSYKNRIFFNSSLDQSAATI